MSNIQEYSGSELVAQLHTPKIIKEEVSSEEQQLIEQFRNLNQLGKTYVLMCLEAFAVQHKFQKGGIRLYKKGQ